MDLRARLGPPFRTVAGLALAVAVAGTVWSRPLAVWTAAALLAIALLSTRAAGLLSRAIRTALAPIGRLQSLLLLTLVFVFVVCPVALVRRVTSGDPLHVRTRPKGSLWVRREVRFGPADLENPW